MKPCLFHAVLLRGLIKMNNFLYNSCRVFAFVFAREFRFSLESSLGKSSHYRELPHHIHSSANALDPQPFRGAKGGEGRRSRTYPPQAHRWYLRRCTALATRRSLPALTLRDCGASCPRLASPPASASRRCSSPTLRRAAVLRLGFRCACGDSRAVREAPTVGRRSPVFPCDPETGVSRTSRYTCSTIKCSSPGGTTLDRLCVKACVNPGGSVQLSVSSRVAHRRAVLSPAARAAGLPAGVSRRRYPFGWASRLHRLWLSRVALRCASGYDNQQGD